MTNTIPTTAEQVALATAAHARIGGTVTIAGRVYSVSRHHWDIRFHVRARYQGENPASAIVDVLRGDLARAMVQPGGYRDLALERAAEAIVLAALRD